MVSTVRARGDDIACGRGHRWDEHGYLSRTDRRQRCRLCNRIYAGRYHASHRAKQNTLRASNKVKAALRKQEPRQEMPQ